MTLGTMTIRAATAPKDSSHRISARFRDPLVAAACHFRQHINAAVPYFEVSYTWGPLPVGDTVISKS